MDDAVKRVKRGGPDKLIRAIEEIGAHPVSEHPLIEGENISEAFVEIDEQLVLIKKALRAIVKEVYNLPDSHPGG